MDHVVGGDAVGGHHEQVVAELVQLADLARGQQGEAGHRPQATNGTGRSQGVANLIPMCGRDHERMLQFDEDAARQVEATYSTQDVIEQRRATRAVLALQPGEHVLDIGSGPGFLAEEMAAEVGPDGRSCGIDPSESMLAMARRREAPVEYAAGDAVALPFGDETFDAAVATQVYEYVTDVPRRWPRRGACCAPAGGC